MADENKLATFKWFTDTYTCGTLDLGISDTIFNYPYYTTSDKVINYKDLVSPDNYNGNYSISNKTNFVDSENNEKCILQSHIKELINNKEIYTYKIGFQKTELLSGNYLGYDCLYVKMIDFSIANVIPPDNKIKIKIIIYDNDDNENIGTSHTVNIPFSTTDKDYTYVIVPKINRVEIVGVSVYRPKYNDSYYDFIIQPNIEYSYTLNLRDYISAANNEYDGDFNGSKITRGGRIDIFVSGSSTPGTGDNSGGSGDSTQKDFVIQDNWVDLETVVNNQSSAKICWAAVEYIINENTILICSDYDIFMGVEPIYALLSNSAEIIERINSISDNDYNNSDKYIYIAFEELYNSEKYKSEIDGLENYEYADDLSDPLPELVLSSFIDYGENLIK